MDSLFSEISQKVIRYWQIAADGVWEEAVRIDVAPGSDDIAQLMAWVSEASDDVALEAFFDGEGADFFLRFAHCGHAKK